MRKKIVAAAITVIMAVSMAVLVLSKNSGNGYDEFGYNYQAHMFNGLYSDSDRVHGGPYDYVNLIMKWNDAWLSNQDRDGDGKLDRHYGFPSYIGSGAWITNHMRATEPDGTKWEWFVKIVALDHPLNEYTNNGGILSYNGEEVGQLIWGEFVEMQSVFNEQGGPHGIEYLVQPAGFGAAG